MRFVLASLPALACAALMFGCIRMMVPHRKGETSDPETAELRLRVTELERRLEQLQPEAPPASSQPGA